MYLYRATKDPFLLAVGEDMLESIEHSTKTECGYATVCTVYYLFILLYNDRFKKDGLNINLDVLVS